MSCFFVENFILYNIEFHVAKVLHLYKNVFIHSVHLIFKKKRCEPTFTYSNGRLSTACATNKENRPHLRGICKGTYIPPKESASVFLLLSELSRFTIAE